jgi:hypothetical protein
MADTRLRDSDSPEEQKVEANGDAAAAGEITTTVMLQDVEMGDAVGVIPQEVPDPDQEALAYQDNDAHSVTEEMPDIADEEGLLSDSDDEGNAAPASKERKVSERKRRQLAKFDSWYAHLLLAKQSAPHDGRG